MSDDWDKAINKNLEQLIIPQLNVLHKVMHRGRSTQRPAASSREITVPIMGNRDTEDHMVPP